MFSRAELHIMRLMEDAMPKRKSKKKKSKQSAAMGAFSALVRPDTKMICAKRIVSESARPLSIVQEPAQAANVIADALEGNKVQVVLITEGLGNRRDMNYYGPEAIDSAPAVFEGAHCFLNHPSVTEEKDIPERRVQDMCGYFKNVQVTVMEGVRTVVGELHFDLSDTGRMGYAKTLTAVHYQAEFPGADKEYIGLSVNASGQSEPKELVVENEKVTVNYVTQFTEAMSCDIVTLPARGGKILALVESLAGASMQKTEVRTMIVKRLQATQSALKEAMASAKTDEGMKQSLTEALRNVESLLKDALAASARSKAKESESETESESKEEESESKEEESEAEDTSSGPVTTVKKTHTIVKKGAAAPKSGDDDADADDEDKEESEESESKEEESEAYESNRLAVRHLIQESGLKTGYFDVEELAHKGLREAKKEIARIKRISEANAKEMLELVAQVSPSHAAKLNESGKPAGKSNNDLFSGCTL